MYYVSPFTYLVSGVLSTGLANAPAFCKPLELKMVTPPSGLSCGAFLAEYLSYAGGQHLNPEALADCLYCPISDTNQFLKLIHAEYQHRWRNVGLLWAYVGFNIVAALGLYWFARVRGHQGVTVVEKKTSALSGEDGVELAVLQHNAAV